MMRAGCFVVYAPVDIGAMQSVISGGEPDQVALLPSGFFVLPDCALSALDPAVIFGAANPALRRVGQGDWGSGEVDSASVCGLTPGSAPTGAEGAGTGVPAAPPSSASRLAAPSAAGSVLTIAFQILVNSLADVSRHHCMAHMSYSTVSPSLALRSCAQVLINSLADVSRHHCTALVSYTTVFLCLWYDPWVPGSRQRNWCTEQCCGVLSCSVVCRGQEKLWPESVETVHNLITCTIQRVQQAMQDRVLRHRQAMAAAAGAASGRTDLP